jgi:DNA-binding GntR family transcriptional regulator
MVVWLHFAEAIRSAMTSDAENRQAAGSQSDGRRPIVAMRRQTIGVQIHGFLRREIITGHLLPRATLSEADLSQRFGVSRTPVREALIKLAEESLIETYPQYGTFVSPIAIADVLDNQFVREAIECSAIERALERVGEQEVRALTRIMDRQSLLEAAGDEEAFFVADEQLHEFFLTLAGHAKAWRVVENAKAQLDRVRHLTMRLPRKLSSVLGEHRIIADRFIAQDRAGTVEAMRTHLRGVFRSIEILQAENPDYFASSTAGPRGRASAASRVSTRSAEGEA